MKLTTISAAGICLAQFLIATISYSQNLKQSINAEKWVDAKPAPIVLDDRYKNEDAVILDEKTEIEIFSQKDVAFNNFEFNTSVKKHVRIKFLTQKGIDTYSSIWLPDCFDPSGDYADVPMKDRNKIHRPKTSITGIADISGRVIKPDGKITSTTFKQQKEEERFIFYDHAGTYDMGDPNNILMDIYRSNSNLQTMSTKEYEHFLVPRYLLQKDYIDIMLSQPVHAFQFKLENLQPGDEVELVYSYKTLTANNRIFFNNALPKQNFDLSISYASNEVYMFDFFNGANPDISPDAENNNRLRTYNWKRKYVEAYTFEDGSRPHLELPFVSYYYHYRDFGKMTSTGDYEKLYPYVWEAYYRKYVNYIEKGFKRGYSSDGKLAKRFFTRPDKNTLALNRFFESRTEGVADTFFLKQMMNVHDFITDSFTYNDDKKWLEGESFRLMHLGDAVGDQVLHNISRTRLYFEMASRLRDDFFITMLCDKRVEALDANKYKPLISWRYFYVVPFKGSYFYFYPKHDRYGYHTNEMPFFYENNVSFLIPQAVPDSGSWHNFAIISFPLTVTPSSSVADNVRNTNVLVNISTTDLKANFDAKVELKGQYSTLTRGYYKYSSTDPTLNENYFRQVWEIPGCAKPDSLQFTNESKEFPFTFNISCTYRSDKFISKNVDGSYALDLTGLAKYIIDEKLDSTKRLTNFYPDFMGQDSYKYFLKFDKDVALLNAQEINFEEKNSFGALRINIVNAQPNIIMLETKFVVNSEKVENEKFSDVVRLFNAVEKLNTQKLVIK